jgi:hypothetical protein
MKGSDRNLYTYTIITTDSNKELKFLHDRMPVIFNAGSEKIKTWLDPARSEWSRELQLLLKPFDGELEVYPVSKDVGKVGNNSPSFIIPVASRENKSNIANFFSRPEEKSIAKNETLKASPSPHKAKISSPTLYDLPPHSVSATVELGIKREAAEPADGGRPQKIPAKSSPSKVQTSKFSSTSNCTKSHKKIKQGGSQKITNFFGNSS